MRKNASFIAAASVASLSWGAAEADVGQPARSDPPRDGCPSRACTDDGPRPLTQIARPISLVRVDERDAWFVVLASNLAGLYHVPKTDGPTEFVTRVLGPSDDHPTRTVECALSALCCPQHSAPSGSSSLPAA